MSYHDLCKTNLNNMDKISYSIAVKSSKELSEKQEKELKRYFSLRKRSNGGECEVTKLCPSLYRVSYQKKEVKERVLNHKDHRIESEGELIQFTVQEEEANDQTNVISQEMSGNVGSLTESSRPSENTELKEMKSFILLDSNFQYKVAKDKIDALCQYFPSLKVCCENRELILSGNISDIRSAREEIKNILHLVKVRKIKVSKPITDFLIFRDSKETSEKLFGDLSEGMVILDIPRGFCLYAFSINLLDQAEEVLQKHLLHGSINIKVNEKDIVLSEPWKWLWDKLIGNTDIKMYFHSNEDNRDLILSIVGFTEEVKKALKECEDLLHCRKIVNKDIYLEPHASILIENLRELIEWFSLGQLSAAVQISRTKDQTVTLTGPHEEVEKSKFVLQKLMQKHVESFCINKYGATNYFNNQGKTLLDDVQKKYDCYVFIRDSENKKSKAEVIEKTKDGSANLVDKGVNKKEAKREASRDKGTHKDGASSSSNQKTENPLKKTTPTLQLVLSFGNLENKKANAIVAPLLSNNPVLEAMNVTKGLKKKAGYRFSNLFSAVFGCHTSLQSGQHIPMAVIGESSYSLICEYVIFIACQPWDGPYGASLKALKKGLSATLNFCQVKSLHSVAMPVIGPGKKLCFPPEAAARIIGEVVKSFVEKEPNTCVKRIEFVIPTENENLYYVCREKLLEMNLGDQIQLCNNDGDTFPKLSKGEHTEAKIGNVSVVVTYTDITKESTDVIVNSTNFSYWNKDTVAHAIFSAAGENIIRAAQHGASREKVVMTEAGSGDLKCKYIMHCNCKQDLGNIPVLVKEILLKCENVGLHSVAIPAIGTGACKLDPGIVAHHIVDCILTLTKTRNLNSLTSVRLVTFHPSIYYIFCAELKKLSSPVQELFWNPLDLLTSRLKHQWLPENEAIKDLPTLQHQLLPPTTQLVVVTDKKDKVNEIKCSLEKGFENAVKYREEKIEQSLLQTFSMEEIEMIFSVLNDHTDVGMIVDRLNNCITIEGCEQDVVEVAMKVHTNLMTVVTARLRMVTKERAGLLVQWGYSDGIDSKPFTVEASQLLEDRYLAGKRDVVIVKLENGVKAVVNLQTMKAVLDEATKRKVKVLRRDLKEDLLTSRLKHQWLPENEAIKDLPTLQHQLLPPTTQLVVVTDKKDKVNEIKCSLEKGFENAVKYREEKIEQSLLQTFSMEEIEMIFSVLNDHTDVGMIVDRLNNCITIEGCEQDVVEVAMKVHTNLMTVVTARLRMVTKERAGLLVQWGYSDGIDSKPFTVEASQLLEDRYLAGKRDVVIVKLENGVKAVVNLQTMKAVLDEATKRKVKVLRRDLKEETQCPLHWDSMNVLFMLVELDPHSEEYETVKSNFNKTVNCPIKKIERIQNTYQYTAYILRKRYITEKNGPSNVNEKNLFHGTAPQNCHSINYSGFNRSFAGHNAALFGNGVYFAEKASYSANQTYSPPDPNTGERFIYQVKVLVGRHTKGQQGMKHPPSRTGNDPFDYYDSLTDKDTNPSMFVVFHDDQAYPEYLITFT